MSPLSGDPRLMPQHQRHEDNRRGGDHQRQGDLAALAGATGERPAENPSRTPDTRAVIITAHAGGTDRGGGVGLVRFICRSPLWASKGRSSSGPLTWCIGRILRRLAAEQRIPTRMQDLILSASTGRNLSKPGDREERDGCTWRPSRIFAFRVFRQSDLIYDRLDLLRCLADLPRKCRYALRLSTGPTAF